MELGPLQTLLVVCFGPWQNNLTLILKLLPLEIAKFRPPMIGSAIASLFGPSNPLETWQQVRCLKPLLLFPKQSEQ